MKFKIGDKIKKPRGKVIYEIYRFANHRFGDLNVIQLQTGKKYVLKSTDGWVLWVSIEPTKKLKTFNFLLPKKTK